MNTLSLALKSRTFWTVVMMFLIGGIQAVSSVLPSGTETYVMGFLALLATYFHLNPSQNYSA